jgi:hypothetical protein
MQHKTQLNIRRRKLAHIPCECALLCLLSRRVSPGRFLHQNLVVWSLLPLYKAFTSTAYQPIILYAEGDTQIIMRQPTKQSKHTQNYLQRMCPMGCQARSHTLLSCAFATSACGPSCLFPIQFKSKPLFLTASCPHCSSTKSAQNHNLPYMSFPAYTRKSLLTNK